MPPAAPPAVSAVPRRWRLLCAVAALVVAGVLTYVGVTLQENATGVARFTTADQVAVVGLGLVLGAGLLALGRPRVDADARGIRVRNLAGERELPRRSAAARRPRKRARPVSPALGTVGA